LQILKSHTSLSVLRKIKFQLTYYEKIKKEDIKDSEENKALLLTVKYYNYPIYTVRQRRVVT